jgi:hypothetical protein
MDLQVLIKFTEEDVHLSEELERRGGGVIKNGVKGGGELEEGAGSFGLLIRLERGEAAEFVFGEADGVEDKGIAFITVPVLDVLGSDDRQRLIFGLTLFESNLM